MSHLIGRGRYARETYPQSSSPSGGDGGGAPNVLTLQPGGSASPPNQFTDWASLYTEFLKTKGPVWIAFDSTFEPSGIVTLPLGTFDMQGRALWVTSGLNPLGGTQVAIPDGGIIKNLLGLNGMFGSLQLNTSSASVEPLQFDTTGFTSFDVTSESAFLQTGSVPVMRVGANQILFLTLDGEININSFPAFAELVNLTDSTSALVLSVFDGFNFFNAAGKLVAGVAGSTIQYLYDSSWPGNPANPNFLGTTAPPIVIDKAAFTTYTAGTPANWVAPPPTDVNSALDRIAAVLNANFGPIP